MLCLDRLWQLRGLRARSLEAVHDRFVMPSIIISSDRRRRESRYKTMVAQRLPTVLFEMLVLLT
jgi:hypothetical protein